MTKSFFAGGSYTSRRAGKNYDQTAVDIFNADTGLWSTSQLPIALSNVTSATLGNEVMFTGSHGGAFLAELYDAASGAWVVNTLASSAYESKVTAAAGNFVATNSTPQDNPPALNFDVLTPSDLATPTNQWPLDGANLGPRPGVFRWSATPGVTAYDVYVDGNLAATVSDNRWAPSAAASTHGSHTWFVAAHVDGGVVRSSPTAYFLQGFVAEGRIQNLGVPSTAASGSTGEATVTISISNLVHLPSSISVAIYGSADYDLTKSNLLLGATVIPFDVSRQDTTLSVPLRVRVPKGAEGYYGLHVVLRIGGSNVLAAPYGGLLLVVPAPAAPPKGLFIGGLGNR